MKNEFKIENKYIICGPRVDQNIDGNKQAIHIAISFQESATQPVLTGDHVVCVPETPMTKAAPEMYELLNEWHERKSQTKFIDHEFDMQFTHRVHDLLAKARGEPQG